MSGGGGVLLSVRSTGEYQDGKSSGIGLEA